jgi:uncharacterized protein (DUF4415 family)
MDASVLAINPETISQSQADIHKRLEPSENEIARFAEVMDNAKANPHQNGDTKSVEVVHQNYLATESSKPLVSLGDTILSRLQSLGSGYQERIKGLEDRINQPITTPAEANKLYFEINQIAVQQQMALAVTGKVNKNAESLLKAQ